MKSVVFCALVASLASEAVARSHYSHIHHHIKREVGVRSDSCGQNIEILKSLSGPLAFRDSKNAKIDAKEAIECLKTCRCKILGERVYVSSPLPQATTSATSEEANFRKQHSPISSPLYETLPAALIPSSTSTPTETQTPEPEPAAPIGDNVPSNIPYNGYDDGYDKLGLDADFPDGENSCAEFPKKYGALYLSHRNGGWSGVQNISTSGTVDKNLKSFILKEPHIHNEISTPDPQECKPGCLCSYACPPGYQKSQWPLAQGANKESIGGLFCDVDNRLYLTRANVKTLCEKAYGGVTILNHLDTQAVLCRTDYPGTENMVIPTVAMPNTLVELTNPESQKSYFWQQKPTSAHYYVNPAGLQTEQVCLWESKDKALANKVGNWAPIVFGASFHNGMTWLSIAPNPVKAPLDNANESLDYSIEITGDFVGKNCAYKKGTKVKDYKGCTVSVKARGQAKYTFF